MPRSTTPPKPAAAGPPKPQSRKQSQPNGGERGEAKIDILVNLLRRPGGATLDEIVKATGWQRHSARGALSGSVRKKLGRSVNVTQVDGVRRYSDVEPVQ